MVAVALEPWPAVQPDRSSATEAAWDCSTASAGADLRGGQRPFDRLGHRPGAPCRRARTVGFSSVESLIERRVRPLAESIGSTFVEPCDVQSDEQIRAVFAPLAGGPRADAQLDVLVHALAFARREDLEGSFVDTVPRRVRDWPSTSAPTRSSRSSGRPGRPASCKPGSSVLTLTYYGAEKVVSELQRDGRRQGRPRGLRPLPRR